MNIVKNFNSGRMQGTKIEIFLSIFDVHIQRSPVDGSVEHIQYYKGRFLPAMNPKATELNEKNTIVLKNKRGLVEVSQIAGILARRIICWSRNGDHLEMGKKYGLICFGSQVDIVVPDSVDIKVTRGDRVKAGITVMGEWK